MTNSTDYDFYKPIAQTIKKLRSQASPKIPQELLAKKSGLSRAVIANIELGRQQILVHVLYKIAKALNISPIDLLPSVKSSLVNTTDDSPTVSPAKVNKLKKNLDQYNFEMMMSLLGK
jgi:transcriptional regulator with XRE-family HTH domain